jgi:two-component system NtrC family sensor kinase
MREESKAAWVVLPIYNDPECSTAECHAHSDSETVLGVMQIDISYAEIDESLTRSRRNLIAFSSFVALGTFVVIILLIRRWVSNPVRMMLEGTRRVADGDLDHAIPVGEGELGALAQAFNRMQHDLQSSQKQLITAEKLASIGKLAASVAHEINNPLTGILTFSEDLLEESDPDDPKIDDYEIIRREAIRCREIVRQLLDYSRQDSPNLDYLDLNEVLSHTVNFVMKQAIFRNVKVNTDLQTDLPPVAADSTQLEQVILGILVNASEAMSERGDICIASSSLNNGREVEVSISDTGPGIAKEHLQRIFEPFFSTKGGHSLGIGLAVSQNIISQHGGRLEVDSEPGEGTTFRIKMPCAAKDGKTGVQG